jgi:aryl-alcohol dehydrogenase-like predicted oxidoreductase
VKARATQNQIKTGWSQILLGTVQFGPSYGRRSDAAPLSDQLVDEILNRAWTLGIRAFDTAESYGRAPARLLDWLQQRGRLNESCVITKVLPCAVTDKWHVQASCQRFAGARSITLLSHGPLDQQEFSKLRTLTAALGAEAGQSVYTADEVQAAARAGAIRVQAPVNVLDWRQLEAAHRCKLSIDARSIFLQGILLDEPEIAERRVPGAGIVTQAVQSAARRVGLSTAAALLAGVLSLLRPHDRALIGIDAPEQLDEVASALEAPLHVLEAFLSCLADLRGQEPPISRLLDPRTWP